MDPIPYPRFADAPQMILLWTVEEAMPVIVGIIIGIMNDAMLVPVLVGVGITAVFRRFRDTKPDGYILHILYWYGIFAVKGAAAINAFHRRILPA